MPSKLRIKIKINSEVWNVIFGLLAILSLCLMLWQWLGAVRFPLHKRQPDSNFSPAVTLLKPLKGCDDATSDCLRSWLTQSYGGPVQILFGVASENDPVCAIVRKLLEDFPAADAQLVICGPLKGANAKVSKLIELERLAKHDLLGISDADVFAPRDFLENAVASLRQENVGLVNSFYSLANPSTLAMRWEAVAINADFWGQVLQAQSLKPLDFALGAAMLTRRLLLRQIGGFEALADCLADDYQLGHRIAKRGAQVSLATIVVECRSAPMGWIEVWKHQLRWARTIRVCQPAPYFFSILSNPTLWPLLWLLAHPGRVTLSFATAALVVRTLSAFDLERRLTRSARHLPYVWLAAVKDLLQSAIWLAAFAGNRVEWRGVRMRLHRDGTLVKESNPQNILNTQERQGRA